jgi:hypothetical protein
MFDLPLPLVEEVTRPSDPSRTYRTRYTIEFIANYELTVIAVCHFLSDRARSLYLEDPTLVR